MKLPLEWVEQTLMEEGRDIQQAVDEENRVQAVLELSMRNSINSLRAINVTNWNDFVEKTSLVEAVLQQDPTATYSEMDFTTRNEYRGLVANIAKKSKASEVDVATQALELAQAAGEGVPESKHVGYYLLGEGEETLKKRVGFKGSLGDRIRDASSHHTLHIYLGSIFLFMIAFTIIAVWLIPGSHNGGTLLYALIVPILFCACHIAVGLANFFSTILVRPRTLPRLNFVKGIPEDQRTLVVIPVIIGSIQNVRSMLRNLETHYLNNRGDNIHFGLLTDFSDAAQENMPQDEELLAATIKGIEKLNEKYQEENGDNFFLFHRPRKWNEEEKVWMAYERKRGKLEDLNRFLVHGDKSAFTGMVGRIDRLTNVKYVITLDADTMLPRESAWQMVGTMAHILNSPRYDAEQGRVVKGHGILQPRVDFCLNGATKTPYAKMSAGEIGIDPYTRASSDVYQDLFDEGSFIGKGIYDVQTFDSALGGLFPDNKILSHDLLEGCVVRSGLVNDVKLFEDPPPTYMMDIARKHRWVRGDWQIANYLFSGSIRNEKRSVKNPLTALSRWKIFDNIRRSLTPLFVLVALVLGFAVFTSPWRFTLAVCCIFIIPVLINAFASLVRKSPDKTFKQHFSNMMQSTARQAVQAVLKLSFMPYESYVNADAIVRSLWRQCVSRRLLLQWTPSDSTPRADHTRLWPLTRRMWISPFLGAAMTVALVLERSAILPYALPFFLLWLASPILAWWLSNPYTQEQEQLDARQTDFLHKSARRIWLFFEDFVTEEENWLPPDNHQEYPSPRTAHRTSPTNMGLSLLANLSARDFGFITSGSMLDRCEKTLATMRGLERFRGHFYNWYDTRTLEILKPAYISTVDSGNLAAHLLILAAGIRELPRNAIINTTAFRSMLDCVDMAIRDASNPGHPSILSIEPIRQKLRTVVDETPNSLSGVYDSIIAIAEAAEASLSAWPEDGADAVEPMSRRWVVGCLDQCRDIVVEMDTLCPWAKYLSQQPAWRDIAQLETLPSLADTTTLKETIEASENASPFKLTVTAIASGDVQTRKTVTLGSLLDMARVNAEKRLARIQSLLMQCEDLSNIEYDFLYDEQKKLLVIGYNTDEKRADQSFYDLLASEARLTTFLGIAQNKLPQAAWFALGRTLTMAEGHPLLVSWGGTMFEYLMPLLVMPTYCDTLLDRTYQAVVAVQSEYGKTRKVPWGISESGYNVFDAANNYQYRAFGVPELGLKHGLSEDLVVSPYSTILASMVSPLKAVENLERMNESGFQATYGFYEAIDYTPSRLPQEKDKAVVRSYMAHHQGMSLVALGQVLLDRPMHRKFESDARFASVATLLQEMVPAERALYYHSTYSPEIHAGSTDEAAPMRILTTPNSPRPEVQLLSNGRYHVMVTTAGGGYSRWQDLAITRWREDPIRDNWGMFCYLKDVDTGETWSTTYQPTLAPARRFEAVFSEGKAEFKRFDSDFDTLTEIVVSPEDDVEIRRVKITNKSSSTKRLHLTSFAEIALAAPADDDSHQAFSKLFVQSRLIPKRQAIVFNRRPRRPEDKTPFAFHLLAVRGTQGGKVTYETDRLAFTGRGRDASCPEAVFGTGEELGNGSGAVFDPVATIRSEITIGAGDAVTVDLVMGVAEEMADVDMLLEKYQDQYMANKAFDMAWTHGQLALRQLDLTETDAQLFCRLASSIIYSSPPYRADPATIMKNSRGQSALWSYAVSGDLPVMLLRLEDPESMHLVTQVIKAHAYWRHKGLKVDLVIWNEDNSGYRQALHDNIVNLAGISLEGGNIERPGGIFVRAADRIPEEDRTLIKAVTRVILKDANGLIEEQIHRQLRSEITSSTTIVQYRYPNSSPLEKEQLPREKLVFDNGFGGFSSDGREYIIHGSRENRTPLPWVNVLANPRFGTVVSESGSSYTWNENSHEYRLTPWANDPVSDMGGEAYYIRDEKTGDFWSPTLFPCPDAGDYASRHGFGYSAFTHKVDGIASEMKVFVDNESPVKFTAITLRNDSGRARTLSVTGYVEWVLGDLRPKTAAQVVTSIDPASGALFAANRYNEEFRSRTVFFDADDPGRTLTGDRGEFIGRNGSLAKPLAMQRANLSGKVGAGLDPCGAIQVRFNLAPGSERTIVFRLGAGENAEEARKLVHSTRGVETSALSLQESKDRWWEFLETIQVETPDQALNFMINGWLLYQALSCRFWGRSATYQSGGAYGFRDQLQDSLAFLYSRPDLTREHIVRTARHQFVEGDAMHWWHPPAGRGVRTRCSDDYLWLPYAINHYCLVTGDDDIWNENVGYVSGRTLRDGEESYYSLPERSEVEETLYEHCKKAIRLGLRLGEHGLPLMGSGDWNDGMDRVGIEGRGESVWLGFFLHTVLGDFARTADARDDHEFAELCRTEAVSLKENLDKHGWDGEWYRRAYFDDGTPLGTQSGEECQIDSLTQSWSVLSGAGDMERAKQAMESFEKRLVDKENKIVKLFTPAFDSSEPNPGYIKGYVPGVRENGGQYTHAAIWAGMAYAHLGANSLAWNTQSILNPGNL